MRTKHALVFLVFLQTFLLAWGSYKHSPNWDEIGHLPAGLSHWWTGSFDLYAVNPPLVRMIAALPVLATEAKTNRKRLQQEPGTRLEFQVGQAFLNANRTRSFWYFSLARWACIPFSWLGMYMCYRWAGDLYGHKAGIAAAAIWCFSPNVLGHGQMITPAVACTALGLAANYAFWKWLVSPSTETTLAMGIALGFAEITKTSWLILYAVWPVCWLVYRYAARAIRPNQQQLRKEGTQLVVAFLTSVSIINMCYGFEGTFKKLGDYRFVSHTLSGRPGREVGNRFDRNWTGRIPVPLPVNYVRGIDLQKLDFEIKHWSYLRGEWRKGGWWYFYAYALLIKVPCATFALVALRLSINRAAAKVWRDEFVLLLPGLVLFILISSQTGFNHHLRYLLPAFPCLFVMAGSLFSANKTVLLQRTVAVLMTWLIASSLWIWPHSLSYFNELVGGPRNGHCHLGGTAIDTNVDCGQDLLYARDWIELHPECYDLRVAFGAAVQPHHAGIHHPPPPFGEESANSVGMTADELGPKPGWFMLSVNQLHNRSKNYSYFLQYEPVHSIGYSIRVFHISDGDGQ